MQVFKLDIKNQLSELSQIAGTIDCLSENWSLPQKLAFQLNLVLEELVINIISYAFEDNADHTIGIEFRRGAKQIRISLSDDGKAFNLLDYNDTSELDKPLEDRKIGGLGIHFVKSYMDEVTYRRIDGHNVVVLTKHF